MTTEQENWITMFNTVKAFCVKNMTTVITIPAFEAAYTQFAAKLDVLRNLAKAQGLQIEGYAVKKMQLKNEVANKAGIVAATISAYAFSIQDEVLKRNVDYSANVLKRMRDIELVPVIDSIVDFSNTHMAALANFGLTAAILDDLNAALLEYNDVIDNPTTAINDRIDATMDLGDMIDAMNELLREQMDKNVQIFTYTNPKFYRKFMLSRRIIDLHGPRNSSEGTLKGLVKDSETLLVIEGALIEVDGTDFILSTNGLGEFKVNLPPGIYTLQVSKDGYTDQEVTGVEVVRGEDVTADVLLEAMV